MKDFFIKYLWESEERNGDSLSRDIFHNRVNFKEFSKILKFIKTKSFTQSHDFFLQMVSNLIYSLYLYLIL